MKASHPEGSAQAKAVKGGSMARWRLGGKHSAAGAGSRRGSVGDIGGECLGQVPRLVPGLYCAVPPRSLSRLHAHVVD